MLISCISVWSISSSTLHAALGPAGKEGKGQLTKNNRKWVIVTRSNVTMVTWLTLWNSKPEIVSCQGYLNRCDSSNQPGPEICHISVSHPCVSPVPPAAGKSTFVRLLQAASEDWDVIPEPIGKWCNVQNDSDDVYLVSLNAAHIL